MSTITYVICDTCGDRVADYDPELHRWGESDEGDEDWCPPCTDKRQAARTAPDAREEG